jgi:hypothetical protein
MIFWDVNLWIYAFRTDSPYHKISRDIIQSGLEDPSGFLFSSAAAASFLRLVTNPSIFEEPSLPREASDFIDYIERHPMKHEGVFDEMAYGIFKHLCLIHNQKGNKVPDAFLAALALRYDCRFITADTGFSIYRGLDAEIITLH